MSNKLNNAFKSSAHFQSTANILIIHKISFAADNKLQMTTKKQMKLKELHILTRRSNFSFAYFIRPFVGLISFFNPVHD